MRARRFIAAPATACTVSGAGLGLGAVVPGTVLSATAAGATTSEEASLLALTNQARASVGAPALTLDAGISSVARSWAQDMAAQGGISHNPDIGSLLDGWLRLAENVGVGATIAQVHEALLNSLSHYANLSNPVYSLVGIGVVSAGGRVYVVENFETPAGGGGTTTPVAEPDPPTTAAPRATTTTPAPPPPPPVRATAAPVAAEAASRPSAATSTFPFVLGALRALDAGHRPR